MIDDTLLKNEERAVFKLRALYKKYGYLPFKMSKFEEYELYMKNKDFLVGDRIITFNDDGGKLLALKPDVTLSVIKNGRDISGCKQKVYYNENVYRSSGGSQGFKEIMQAGVECIGDIDFYDISESVLMAAESLAAISDGFVLNVSHLGILQSILDETSDNEEFRQNASRCIAGKNVHDLKRLCVECGISAGKSDKLCRFIGIYGNMENVIENLKPLCSGKRGKESLAQLEHLYLLLKDTEYRDRISFDFSIVNDMNYYNGIVFKGYLDGICEGVLSGGQYDNLMKRMNRSSGAVGFAIYLNLLDGLKDTESGNDIDVLLLYDGSVTADAVAAKVREIIATGKSVSAEKTVPEKLRFGEITDMRGGDAK